MLIGHKSPNHEESAESLSCVMVRDLRVLGRGHHHAGRPSWWFYLFSGEIFLSREAVAINIRLPFLFPFLSQSSDMYQ